MYESEDKMVSHPGHYQTKSGLETIDVIEAFTDGLNGIEATDTGNIIKYACRWKQKNGIQDLEKILWYTQHLIDHLKNKKTVEEVERAAKECPKDILDENSTTVVQHIKLDSGDFEDLNVASKYYDRSLGRITETKVLGVDWTIVASQDISFDYLKNCMVAKVTYSDGECVLYNIEETHLPYKTIYKYVEVK